MNLGIILSQNQTWGFKYIVWVLGKIMEGIFNLLDLIGIPNIGLSIIIFTIVVNICMLPLTYKQQKFSKMSQIMNPEIKALQKKYEGKKDQDSQLAMNNEMQAIYAKYGVSPTGSCLYLLIQMPILFALYRVIYQVPGYVSKVKDAFYPLVTNIASNNDAVELIKNFSNSSMYSKQFDNAKYTLENTIIDCLNRASSADFQSIKDNFANLSVYVDQTLEKLNTYNNFLGLNIGNTPWYTMKTSFAAASTDGASAVFMGIGALMIPLLAGVTQWLNVKLAPQPQANDDKSSSSMTSSMKVMNNLMPLMSVWFCFTLPAGMGLYWIASAVVRGIIMVIMNKKIDKTNIDDLIKKNSGKAQKKMAKRKAQQEKLNAYASMSTRNIASKSNSSNNKNNSVSSKNTTSSTSAPKGREVETSAKNENSIHKTEEQFSRFKNITEKSNKTSSKDSPVSSGSGSMMAKANAVKNFNEKNNK